MNMEEKMKTMFKTKEFECNAIFYDGTNGEEVHEMFPNFQVSGGKLYDGTILVNSGFYIVDTPSGTKKFSKSVFEGLFEMVPEKTYRISDLELKEGVKIRNTKWTDQSDHIEWTGFAWKFVGEEMECLYTLTPEDLVSDSWVLV